MKNLETNKIAAAILIAGLIALISGKIANGLYFPHEEEGAEAKRGFAVEVAATTGGEAGAAAAPEAPVDVAALMATANAAEGANVFKKCASCHTAEPGAGHRVGPNLAGVVGSPKARHSDYAYSDAIKAKGGNWSEEELFHFLKKPQAYIPGSKMTFAGLKNPQDIANVVAYLKAGK
jgi:cytochrome c